MLAKNGEAQPMQGALASMQHYQDKDSGYSKQQSTRPQSLGYGLVDMESNIQDTRLRDVPWGEVGHGAALVSCGLALEGLYLARRIGKDSGGGETVLRVRGRGWRGSFLSGGLGRARWSGR